MPILAWIVAVTLFGGLLSVLAAGAFALRARPTQVPMLISYAIGTLLGAAFLEILPHALELSGSAHTVMATVLLGLLLFFVLEKLMLWRHRHDEELDPHELEHAHKEHRIALMVIVGDTFHNCVDGVIIAGAFLVSVELGIITAVAIITHEVPQEVGDFLVLLHSGFGRTKALIWNAVSGLSAVLGGLIAYFALSAVSDWLPEILAFAAASMIYVAVADLIPGLHRRTALKDSLTQVTFIALGVFSIWAIHALLSV